MSMNYGDFFFLSGPLLLHALQQLCTLALPLTPWKEQESQLEQKIQL